MEGLKQGLIQIRNMKAVSWNYRRLGGENKVEAIRNIIKSERPDILLHHETKMSDVEVLALSQHFWTNI